MKKIHHMLRTTLLLLFMAMPFISRAQEVEIPANIQYSLLAKILAFDRNISTKVTSKGDLTVGIIYQEKVRTSLLAKDEMVKAMQAMGDIKVNGYKITYKLIPLPETGDIKTLLNNADVSLFYLTPLRGIDLNTITTVAQARKKLTMSGVAGYCDKGVSVCLERNGENPGIAISVASTKLEGCDFSSQLLKIARVIL